MSSGVAARVAVIGSGISGAVCASTLAKNGVSVTVFESARGPGGRMSQRRETSCDGKELLFDHGAPFFTVSNSKILDMVQEWESRGLVSEWKENFGSFDAALKTFDTRQDGLGKKYVGVPGMNSICNALCHEPGIESKYSTGVGKLEWVEEEMSWFLTGLNEQNLGCFQGVVTADKFVVSPIFRAVTGRPPPLALNLLGEFSAKLQDIPVRRCYALMLAYQELLASIPLKGFSIKNSPVLSWAHCDSSKPGHSTTSERWVLHSTPEYADRVVSQTGFRKPSDEALAEVAETMLQEFQGMGLNVPQPMFMKAHRWGSAFPAICISKDEKCIWVSEKKLALCGDFCVSPNVEGAILSGLAAASRLLEIFGGR